MVHNFNCAALITSHKMDAQKLANSSTSFIHHVINKKATVKNNLVVNETNAVISKIKARPLSSVKMSEEKREALNNYILELEDVVAKEPNNIPLRAQLANVKALLIE